MTGQGSRCEAPELAAFLRRMARALARRAGAGELDALSALAEARAAIDAAIAEGARAAHDGPFGYSWTEIGNELGITRQAARQRFATNTRETDDE